MDEQNLFIRQGWQCPICHRVYSPDTPMCYYCGNETIMTSSTMPISTETNEYSGTETNEYIVNTLTKGTMILAE